MSDISTDIEEVDPKRSYWLTGTPLQVAKGLTGIVAVLVALKAVAYEPVTNPVFEHQDHIFRILAFAALTVWTTLTLGVKRRGMAAMVVLAFASFVEIVLMPARGEYMFTVASANLGIVFAYCGMQLYWMNLVRKRLK